MEFSTAASAMSHSQERMASVPSTIVVAEQSFQRDVMEEAGEG